jgi:hypothetical protein
MPFTGNFTAATVDRAPEGDGKALFVEGRANGPNQASAIFALIRHDDELLTQPVDDPRPTDWTAVFLEGDTPFSAGDDLVVTGVAIVDDEDEPVFWQSIVTIEEEPS